MSEPVVAPERRGWRQWLASRRSYRPRYDRRRSHRRLRPGGRSGGGRGIRSSSDRSRARADPCRFDARLESGRGEGPGCRNLRQQHPPGRKRPRAGRNRSGGRRRQARRVFRDGHGPGPLRTRLRPCRRDFPRRRTERHPGTARAAAASGTAFLGRPARGAPDSFAAPRLRPFPACRSSRELVRPSTRK